MKHVYISRSCFEYCIFYISVFDLYDVDGNSNWVSSVMDYKKAMMQRSCSELIFLNAPFQESWNRWHEKYKVPLCEILSNTTLIYLSKKFKHLFFSCLPLYWLKDYVIWKFNTIVALHTFFANYLSRLCTKGWKNVLKNRSIIYFS